MSLREFPLTEAQSGLWFAQRLAPENPAFNTAHLLWMHGELNVDAFCQAVQQATRETDAFALRMIDHASGPTQVVDEGWRPKLEVVDLRAAFEPERVLRETVLRDRLKPLDPTRDPLVRQMLFLLPESRSAWFLRVHHLATDGYGMSLFTDRLCTLYQAALVSSTSTGAPLASVEAVFEEDSQYRQSEKRARDAAFWTDALQGMPAPAGLGPGFAAAAEDCLRWTQPVDQEFQHRLHQIAEEIGQPWPDVLTALTAAYCQRMGGMSEAVVGIPFMGRLGSPSARVPMLVMNVLPLRVEGGGALTVGEYVRSITTRLLKSRRHGRYRGEQIRRDLGFLGGQRRLYGPLINVQPFYRPHQLAGVQTSLEILSTGPVDDVNLGFRGDARLMFDLEIEANPQLYSQSDIEAHAQRLLHFLSSAFEVHARHGLLSDIELATPAEQQRYLFDVNDTEHPVPETTLVALYEAQMRNSPASPALEFEGAVLSYRELEIRTRALALQLRGSGVGRESIVAVALPRSLELVIALLAIQRAGGAYLPLDLDHPDSRLAAILQSASPVCVLTQANDAHRFQTMTPVLPTDEWEQSAAEELHVDVQPDDAAYVIYTSGSTGTPKGVLIEHRAIVNRLEWMRTHYGFDASDRFLQKTPATFDVSVWEFFLPYLTGASLVVAPPEAHRNPVTLARIIREQRISTLHFVPSMLSAFLEAPSTNGLKLRRVFCSGEELTAAHRERFHQKIDAELHNLYGPTEAAVDVSYWPATRDDDSRPMPIGFPVWNTQLYVLDDQLRPVPGGVAGDLYLGGVQLARGYLGRDDLTAERFLPSPFRAGERIYRTGDIARWRDDGAVVYLGRSDHQVKIRGLRIELGEIEAALRRAPGVSRTEVIVREDRPGEKRLVAYLQVQGEFDAQQFRSTVAAIVPDYMVPSAFMKLQEWPVTSNGKLDRRALPIPARGETSELVPLRTDTERDLASVFREVLVLETEVGGDADFFALGGDSLQAVHLLLAIEKKWQRDPGLEALFTSPTVSGLAKIIESGMTDIRQGLGPVIKLSEGDPALAPVFVVHPAGGICWNYRELAHQLEPRRNVYGLQSPELDRNRATPDSIESLSDEYSERAIELAPRGSIHLIGWSVGGIIAQAMAVRLQQRGRDVGEVVLLDAYPSECWRAEPEPGPIAALRALLAIAGYDPDQHPELDSRHKILAFLRKGTSGLGNLPEPVLDGVVRAVTGTNRLVRQHVHTAFQGRLLHLRAGRDHASRPHLQSQLWAAYASEVEAIALPCVHAEMTRPRASALIASILNERLQRGDHLSGGGE